MPPARNSTDAGATLKPSQHHPTRSVAPSQSWVVAQANSRCSVDAREIQEMMRWCRGVVVVRYAGNGVAGVPVPDVGSGWNLLGSRVFNVTRSRGCTGSRAFDTRQRLEEQSGRTQLAGQSDMSRYQATVNSLSRIIQQDPGLPRANPTRSYWQDPPVQLPSSSTQAGHGVQIDVTVIGSGITGCSVARHLLLSDPRIHVVMLEARKAASGATGRNGGHLKATPELSYAASLPVIGKEKAREVVDFTLKNVRDTLQLAETLEPNVRERSEVRRVDALNVFIDPAGFDQMKSVVERFDADNPDLAGRLRPLGKEELRSTYGIAHAAGGFVSEAGAAWPYRLVTDLLVQLIKDHGERFDIREDSPVSNIDFSNGIYRLQTPTGIVEAKRLVHATNGHAGHLLPGLRGTLFPFRGQMTAQTPSQEFGIQGHLRSWSIHYPAGFDYITQSGKSGEIFAGGGRSLSDPLLEVGSTRDDENAVLSIAHLAGIMDATFGFPVREKVHTSWTGVLGFTADGLPLVGRLPAEATLRDGVGEWIAAGYNGYGMANAWLCGKHVAESLLGLHVVESIPQTYVVTRERINEARDTAKTAEYIMKELGPQRMHEDLNEN